MGRLNDRLKRLEGGTGGTCKTCGYPLHEEGRIILQVVYDGGREGERYEWPCDHTLPKNPRFTFDIHTAAREELENE